MAYTYAYDQEFTPIPGIKPPELPDGWETIMPQLHREVIRLVVMGYTNTEIAEQTGITMPTVISILANNIVQQHIQNLMMERDGGAVDIHRTIQAFAPAAIARIQKLALDETVSSAVALKACQDMLDRDGRVMKPTTSTSVNMNVPFNAEVVEFLKQRARDIGITTASPVDIPVEPSTDFDTGELVAQLGNDAELESCII